MGGNGHRRRTVPPNVGMPAELADIRLFEGDSASEEEEEAPRYSQRLAVQVVAPTAAPSPEDGGGNEDVENRRRQQIVVTGWSNTRIASRDDGPSDRKGGFEILWTPTTKTLWVPLPSFFRSVDSVARRSPPGRKMMPLHRLRVSASDWRLCLGGDPLSDDGAESIALPFGVVADNVRIEIGPPIR